MRFYTPATIICLLASSFGTALAKEQPSPVPAIVQAELNEMIQTCRDFKGKFIRSPDLLTAIDLTGDGISDYVINQGAYNCDGDGASIYSGSGGSQVIVYVGRSEGQAYLAFSTGAYEMKINKSINPAKLLVVVRGELCGQQNVENLSNSALKACWRPIEWKKSALKMNFAPLSQVRFIR
jgi:hypothetical protein